ncbi:E3 ubiquitin-protein ligase RNF183 [Sphaeramia orbicularis]|uniref:E3 ubiquitin-protein ligase RNF183 n=1 Tax=Sphaeramia orbicularis TaxID=375764 RepID=UPI00117D2ECD|nr:RING finger protein 225-like [Sphaeramia orbicularis]
MSDRRGPDGHSNRRPVQNVKPRMSNKGDNWKKPEKPTRARRSRSIDSERGDRGRRRDRQQGEPRRRGRSEEARGRDRREGESDRKKPRPPEDDVDDTECAICFCSYDNIFKTPKLLACGHTFCLECLARINVSSVELKSLSCPVCREVTELRHGKDLPRLGNNQDIIDKLPPEMHRALSIRFKRSKGKLVLKSLPPTSPTSPTSPTTLNSLSLPVKNSQVTAGDDVHLNAMEQGMPPTTVVDVGRPPNQVRGRLRRLFRSDRCYYAVVASIVTITVALMLVGILAFVIIPHVTLHTRPVLGGNHTVQGQPGGPRP